jgi:hypothetical protein
MACTGTHFTSNCIPRRTCESECRCLVDEGNSGDRGMTCCEIGIVSTKEQTCGKVMTTARAAVYHTEDNVGSLTLMIYLSARDSACYSATYTKTRL